MLTATYRPPSPSGSSSSTSLLIPSSVANLSVAARSFTRLDEILSTSSNNKDDNCLNNNKLHEETIVEEDDDDEDDDSTLFLHYRPYRASQLYRRRRCSLVASMDSCRMETIFEEEGE
ncbi:hypothetical protein BDA99DRAFT_568565 [Phascolomyces articulosus]|uniref:Uncharacterized protein n=1 Tax=Phascolomyces articulosus TaxID=60185 RepID=A0AAD5PIB4_9FUNG|nr:hypothetical protein BDA99DRAFT_568565 [Phascolomyces articulosus]